MAKLSIVGREGRRAWGVSAGGILITEMMSSTSVGSGVRFDQQVPGPELTAVINQRIQVQTPFRVEFRSP
jgi:hypothetical protein